jgi:hypothetical protein
VLLNQILGFRKLLRLEAVVRVEFNSRFDPELRLPVSMLDMYVRPPFLSREEIKAETSNAQAVGLTTTGYLRRSISPRLCQAGQMHLQA